VLDACRRSLRLCFSHFATRTVDNTVDLYAAKPDIRPESLFCLTHLHSTPPLVGFPSEYHHRVWYGKTRMVYIATWRWINFEDVFIRFDMIHERDRRTDGTDRQTPHVSQFRVVRLNSCTPRQLGLPVRKTESSGLAVFTSGHFE